MAKVTIADLDAAGALDGTELVEIEQGGESKQTTTQDIADLGGGGAGYLVYTALLTQTDTDAPVATVLENTLGGTVVWTRSDIGAYLGTLANTFTDAKTVCFMGNNLAPNGYFGKSAEIPGDDDLLLQTADGNGSNADELLYQTSIEIRVYP